ncbi:hypothetical protein KOW79_019946 [Hemibagrus wyckioides]|uniref:Coiled-coil domain-containing protein 25 n=1 Tax=Hemibagrus wyckioides TaxID=337641 RepID=A0A9D3N683_9TELE|nr:hypothetical protein KOW79_019946 [Hemibagrus wyckioides]
MVFYFTSAVVTPPYTIYMGKDKYENEDLIKYGWPEDIWFHVDKLSSAHVYLRLPKGKTIDDIPKEVLIDCAQLVKNNSIQGCKMNNINVVYTPWGNLKKTGDMDVGQIGFHRQKEVRTVAVEKKINEIINRLEKTKEEKYPDLAAEKESRDREDRNEKKAQIQEMKRKEKEETKRKKEQEELRNYSSLMRSENMTTNEDGNDSDDFIEDHEECSKIKDVRGEITGRLSKIVNIISQSKEEDSDAKVVFCPIVSRAGTDIEATLSHLRDDKPTIVFVLHHTFTTDYSAPRSSRYEKKNLIMVDILFHEDLGLLNCSKNDAALSKASTYLKHYAKLQYEVNTTRVILCAVGILVSHKLSSSNDAYVMPSESSGYSIVPKTKYANHIK